MSYPENLKYTKDHEWAKIEGKIITVGITDHAQKALGDVVYVDLPSFGKTVKAGDPFGVVESIKAVSDLYSPIAGKIIEINSALADDPALVNREPQGSAWMVKIETNDPAPGKDLMDAASYTKYVQSLS